MKTIKGYKFIKKNMCSDVGGTKWRKGIWKKHKGELELCKKGFHACRTPLQSIQYVLGGRWFTIEAKGKILEEKKDKFVASEMRLIKEIPIKPTLVEFAVRCAERCIKNFEKKYPKDKRPREAIEAAKAWINKPCKKTREAARSAESAAESVESVAWSAAESAESAARSAARSVVWSAARSAESAARSAESAAESAESAARSAARSVVWSAARSVVWSAEKKWQERILKKIINRYLKGVKK